MLDADVLVAALRNPIGASAALLGHALGDDPRSCSLCAALVLEYEVACRQPVYGGRLPGGATHPGRRGAANRTRHQAGW